MKRILITGGGSGGHVYPSIAVLEELRKRDEGKVRYVYIGAGTEIEDVIRQKVDRHYTITTGKFRRYFSFKNFTDVFRVPVGFFQSLYHLLRELPDVVFSKGGYVAFPVVVAAWLYRIPIVTHESDAIPGAANRFLGKFSTRIALGYESASSYFFGRKLRITGNPVPESALEGDAQKARKYFKLTESRPTILVVGGSQGSKLINENISKFLDEILAFSQIIHQTGKKNYDETAKLAAQNAGIKAGRRGYHIDAYLNEEETKMAYAVADLVIARAGATTVAEIAANEKVAIFIPLANSANDHQRMNAYEIAETGGAIVLEEANLSEHVLMGKLKKALFDEELRKKMKDAIKEFYYPNAAEDIAEEVLSVMKK